MHVLIGFIILVGFISGYYPMASTPKDEVNIAVHAGEKNEIRLRNSIIPLSEFEYKNISRQEFDYSCGSAALSTLLNYYLGEELSEKQIIHGMMKYGDSEQIAARRAFSLYDMKKFVDVLGYSGAGYKADISDILSPETWPGIVPIKLFGYRHFVVLRGVYQNHVFVADPWRGNMSFTLAKFKDIWYQNVIFLVSPPDKSLTISLLEIRVDDLRFIDEDTARNILKDNPKMYDIPEDVKNQRPENGRIYYDPKAFDYSITSKQE